LRKGESANNYHSLAKRNTSDTQPEIKKRLMRRCERAVTPENRRRKGGDFNKKASPLPSAKIFKTEKHSKWLRNTDENVGAG